MSWRTVIINANSNCKVYQNHLIINHKVENKIPLEEIKVILIKSSIVTITAPVITKCLEHKIMLIHLSDKFTPLGFTLPYFGVNNPYYNQKLQLKICQSNLKNKLWKYIVRSKCQNQINLLEILNLDVDYLQSLNRKLDSIKIGDKSNIEGYIAKEFFKNIYGKWFKRFSDNKINSAINFAYTIIVSELSRILATKRFILQIGIHHIGNENPLNLSYDLIEPFRAFADYFVFFAILSQSESDELTVKEKYKIVEILDMEITIIERVMSLSDAMKIYVESLIAVFKDENFENLKLPELKDINNFWEEYGL